MKIIIAWIKKYILHVHSPSAHAHGYDFEYDYLRAQKNKRIKEPEHEVMELNLRIGMLEAELEESRAKEGHGAFERMMDGIADAVAGIGNLVSSMSPEELRALAETNDDEEDDT